MPKTPGELFAYGSILEALSTGLYPDKRHIIREFVQNSFDSIFELRRFHPKLSLEPITVKISPPSIFIADTGIGMNEAQIKQFRYLGFSQKERAKHAGFRGIGKYSGSDIAEKLIVDSSPYGIAKKYRVVIHADRMMAEIQTSKNVPLEDVLRKHTEWSQSPAKADEHFTFVELHKIGKDASGLLDPDAISEYLARTAPVPFDPKFRHGSAITKKLQENVPDFLAPELEVNGASVHKPYFEDVLEPEFETVLFDDAETDVLAFCWYCQNSAKGQLEPKDDAGLVFKVKNISVGDGQLSRRMLWKQTPERAFYFFGEIHVLDSEVTPSSDRTDFEDNAFRRRLAERCLPISSNLRRKAGRESALRRFDEALAKGNEIIAERGKEVGSGRLPIEIRDQVAFELQTIQEDVKKRLGGPATSQITRRANRLMGRTRKILHSLRSGTPGFIDLRKELRFNPKLRLLYDAIMNVLSEEFRHQPDRLEKIVRKIHEALRARLSA